MASRQATFQFADPQLRRSPSDSRWPDASPICGTHPGDSVAALIPVRLDDLLNQSRLLRSDAPSTEYDFSVE